jgi:ubiquinone/menaquinone biosynthesis C-methylase UbiE
MKSPDLERVTVEAAYARWAPIHDAVCGPVMVNGRRAAAKAARDVGGKILEVGVGTGLSFDDYDFRTEITGIDLSAPMLAKAREKMASGRYPYVRDVRVMDAHRCPLPTRPSIAWSRNSSSRWWKIPSRCFRNATAW